MGYSGLNPILPFLGGRSDAACRVVFRHSRREATRAAASGMGNSPTGIAIVYKSGWRRGVSLLEYGGLKPILPVSRRT